MPTYATHPQDATTDAPRLSIETADSLAAVRIIKRGVPKRDARTLRRSAQASKVAAALTKAQDCSGIRAALLRLEAALLDAKAAEESKKAEALGNPDSGRFQPEHAQDARDRAAVIRLRAMRLCASAARLQARESEALAAPVAHLFGAGV